MKNSFSFGYFDQISLSEPLSRWPYWKAAQIHRFFRHYPETPSLVHSVGRNYTEKMPGDLCQFVKEQGKDFTIVLQFNMASALISESVAIFI